MSPTSNRRALPRPPLLSTRTHPFQWHRGFKDGEGIGEPPFGPSFRHPLNQRVALLLPPQATNYTPRLIPLDQRRRFIPTHSRLLHEGRGREGDSAGLSWTCGISLAMLGRGKWEREYRNSRVPHPVPSPINSILFQLSLQFTVPWSLLLLEHVNLPTTVYRGV